ncbi:hypothetical protein FEM33_06905 [Dyadobacter flavalbus]|uniref:Lipoprotein n=1 Tax=Dyadobacter flavalbus TaxID=2579942 RepID=A0A5M8QY77_9BACT|nr:hypothetical protein FEM33_06905 [Dyadobacter flavalbus]
MIRFRALMLLLLTSIITLFGCKGLKDNPKFAFADGVYHSRVQGKKAQVYIENTEDSVIVYALKKGWQRLSLKASSLPKQSYPQKANAETIRANRYWQNGFDVDILTIPLKFRPSAPSFPRQFSNNLNGAVYLGFRNDTYRLSYDRNPIGQINQKIKHYGISAGIITGLGATAMNPYVTSNQIAIEYDGMIWSKGAAVIMGIDNFTFGIIGGIDHLLDKNSVYWLYNGKPYLGLAVGLNLN